MIYNQQRHIQSLKRSQDFKDEGKSFYKESPEESLKLSNYNAAIIPGLIMFIKIYNK